MSEYKQIKTCSFTIPVDYKLEVKYHLLKFPQKWLNILQNQINTSSQSNHQKVSIRSLNNVLLAYLPNIVKIGRNIDKYPEKPWLYCCEKIDLEIIVMLIHSWINSSYDNLNEEQKEKLITIIKPEDLQWETQSFILNEWSEYDNQTAKYREENFELLPDFLVSQLTGKSLLIENINDGNKKEITFYRCINPSGQHTELLSEVIAYNYQGKGKDKSKNKTDYYSIVIKFKIQTIPWQNYPLLFCSFSLRRWIKSTAKYFPPSQQTSVYIKTDGKLENTNNGSFLVTQISHSKYIKNEKKQLHKWISYIPKLLTQTCLKQLPDIEKLIAKPQDFPDFLITYKDGITLSEIIEFKKGFTPCDRISLFNAVKKELSVFGFQETKNIEKDKKFEINYPKNYFLIKDSKNNNREDILNEINKLVEERLGEKAVINFHIFYQDSKMEELLRDKIKGYLGEKAIIFSENLSKIGSELTLKNQDIIKNNKMMIKAINEREKEIKIELDKCFSEGAYHISLIELQNHDYFEKFTDPKLAIRLGFAKLGSLTQFITPLNKKTDDEHRIKSAVLDSIRQILLSPAIHPLSIINKQEKKKNYSLENTQIIALWILKKNRQKTYNKHNYIPLFLSFPLNLTKVTQIKVLNYNEENWISYHEAIMALAKDKLSQCEDTNKLKNVIQSVIERQILPLSQEKETIVLTHAQNSRSYWQWLQNSHINHDSITFEHNSKPLKNYPQLKIVRLRSSQSLETPQYVAENPETSTIGLSKGLWKVRDDVFYSSGDRSQTHPMTNKSSKIVDVGLKNDFNVMPNLLEISVISEDESEKWASLIHRLRFACLNFNEALHLPLPLYLAKQLEEYRLLTDDSEEN